MRMVIKKLMFLGAISIIISFNFAMAANYTVGDPNGSWDQSTDLTTWASSQTFVEGDNLSEFFFFFFSLYIYWSNKWPSIIPKLSTVIELLI